MGLSLALALVSWQPRGRLLLTVFFPNSRLCCGCCWTLKAAPTGDQLVLTQRLAGLMLPLARRPIPARFRPVTAARATGLQPASIAAAAAAALCSPHGRLRASRPLDTHVRAQQATGSLASGFSVTSDPARREGAPTWSLAMAAGARSVAFPRRRRRRRPCRNWAA